MQLMTAEGLLLSGEAQKVKVCVAAEFCSGTVDVVGAWSKRQYTATLDPQHALLLHSQPPKALGRNFVATSTACTHTYAALYGWTPACIIAALGKQGGLQGLFHRLSKVMPCALNRSRASMNLARFLSCGSFSCTASSLSASDPSPLSCALYLVCSFANVTQRSTWGH
jgi:hypothetical protein